ncbi:hypothetical protein C477_19864, partial [Haloterrigena salina JCM 13891]
MPELVAADGRAALDGRSRIGGVRIRPLVRSRVVVREQVDLARGRERAFDEGTLEPVDVVSRPVSQQVDRALAFVGRFAEFAVPVPVIPPVFPVPVDDCVRDGDRSQRGGLGRRPRDATGDDVSRLEIESRRREQGGDGRRRVAL